MLRGVDLTIPSRQADDDYRTGGEGKSVAETHHIGLMQPDRGEVWIDGTDIAHMKGRSAQ